MMFTRVALHCIPRSPKSRHGGAKRLRGCATGRTMIWFWLVGWVLGSGAAQGAGPATGFEQAATQGSAADQRSNAEGLCFAQGILIGEVGTTTALVQVRLTAVAGPELDAEGDIPGRRGLVRFVYGPVDAAGAEEDGWRRTDWLPAVRERDSIVRAQLTGLEPGVGYGVRVEASVLPQMLVKETTDAGGETVNGETVNVGVASAVVSGPTGRFRTLGGAGRTERLRFCMGSCMHYHAFMSGRSNGGGPVTATADDRRLGYPAFAAMREVEPEFFIGTGDIVYYDHPRETRAQTRPQMLRKWHEQFRFPRLVEFFAETPAYWSKDDHDFRFDDADLREGRAPSSDLGIDLFREQLPVVPSGNDHQPTYRTHRVHRHLQLWFVEGRDYRSPNRMEDGPEKTIWGAEQRAWLERTLRESDATWKIIISPTPMVGPDRASKRDNHTNPRGFRHEGESFMRWLNREGLERVMVFCGDRHWQFHSVHPLGLEEFGCGALNDENSIRGIGPGAKGSTDPEGEIDQRYRYPRPTGGFLQATVDEVSGEARLVIELKDDEGATGYRVERAVRTDI